MYPTIFSVFSSIQPFENTLGYILWFLLSSSGENALLIDLVYPNPLLSQCGPLTHIDSFKNEEPRAIDWYSLNQQIKRTSFGDLLSLDEKTFLHFCSSQFRFSSFHKILYDLHRKYSFIILNCNSFSGPIEENSLLLSDFAVYQIDAPYCEKNIFNIFSKIKDRKMSLQLFCLPVFSIDSDRLKSDSANKTDCSSCPAYNLKNCVKDPGPTSLKEFSRIASSNLKLDKGYVDFVNEIRYH